MSLAARGERVVIAVADGAGSAARGGAGAAIACRTLAHLAAEAAAARSPRAVADEEIAGWFADARGRIALAAERAGLHPRDCATTAILALSDGAETLCAHVGDGASVVRAGGSWRALSWPESGEHAGTTRFLTEDEPAVRLSRLEEPVTALALFTDGIERLVLDLAAREPHPPFFDMIAAPLDRLARLPQAPAGRDRALSAALGRYLCGEAVNERTDDDKTLAVAVRHRERGA